MSSSAPAAKVNAATIAAALTSLVLYLVKAYIIKDATGVPEPIAYAVGVLITAAVTFAAGYLTPPHAQDTVEPVIVEIATRKD